MLSKIKNDKFIEKLTPIDKTKFNSFTKNGLIFIKVYHEKELKNSLNFILFIYFLNVISTFVGYLIPKPSLKKNSSDTI